MTSSPAITVLMCAYNAEATISESIESILSQDFEDFEFLIVNDGSHDGTLGIIKSYAKRDGRIRVIDQANMGVSGASNRGLREARGEFVARLDADDVALSHRLRVQHELLSSDSSIVLVGGVCVNIYAGGEEEYWRFYDESGLRRAVFLRAPFAHSTAMFRRDVAVRLGGYSESFLVASDMDFWMRLAGVGRVLMVNDVLVRRYLLESGITLSHPFRQHYNAMRARFRHNSFRMFPYALAYGFYSLVIAFLPIKLVLLLKNLRGRLLGGRMGV